LSNVKSAYAGYADSAGSSTTATNAHNSDMLDNQYGSYYTNSSNITYIGSQTVYDVLRQLLAPSALSSVNLIPSPSQYLTGSTLTSIGFSWTVLPSGC